MADGTEDAAVENEAEAEEGEKRDIIIPKTPEMPTKAQIEEHCQRAHLPYRSWCEECVRGRKKNPPHKRVHDRERDMPCVCLDYCFLRDSDAEETLTVLVSRDADSRVTFADVCPQKGVHEYAVEQTLMNLKRLGHTKMAIKSDQEPALTALINEVKEKRHHETLTENSPVKESASNNVAEKAVQQVEEQVRVLKLGLQKRLHNFVPTLHPIMTWLIPHAADMLTKLEVGSDGHTAYERLRKKKYRGEVVEFGSRVMYREPGALHAGRGKLESRWHEGIWLGKRWESDEHIIATENKRIVKCRAVQQVPADRRWNKDQVEAVTGLPWKWIPDEEAIPSGVIFRPITVEAAKTAPEPEQVPRSMKIEKSILDKHGYTATCTKCRAMNGMGPSTTAVHSAECRRRIEDAVAADEQFKHRLAATKRRMDEYVAIKGEEEMRKRQATEANRAGGEQASSSSTDPAGSTHTTKKRGFDEVEPDKDGTENNEMVDMLIEPTKDSTEQDEMVDVLMSLGVRSDRIQKIVSEIYSPPRVTAAATINPDVGVGAGFAMDLTTKDENGQPWDFDDPRQRRRAIDKINAEKPFVVIGSPMCTAFSLLQALNWGRMRPEDKERIMARAVMHLEFCLKIYEIQRAAGRYFLHEHPATATSWRQKAMIQFLQKHDVHTTVGHMCQYGMTSKDKYGRIGPVYKPTKWMSNSPAILSRLSRRCTKGQHQHVQLIGGRAAAAAIYPPNLCLQILRGVRDQARIDDSTSNEEECTMDSVEELNEANSMEENNELHQVDEVNQHTRFYDEVTGQELDRKLVMAARAEELGFFHKKGVYTKVPAEQAKKTTGRGPISIRWVYVNKGDEQHPDIRARLVAREIRQEASDGSMYAATPPLETIKWLLSTAASSPHLVGTKNEIKISFVDARRAYFNAACHEDVFVQLPHEDRGEGMCGKLAFWMYGTRLAASKWEQHYSDVLVQMGFTKGAASPCTFAHKTRNLKCVVHGDDFTTAGRDEDLSWFENKIQKFFEVKLRGRLGSSKGDSKEIRILNRIARYTDGGYEWEADPRHAEIIIQQLGLTDATSVGTPGVKENNAEQDEEELQGSEATAYRALAARANFLSMDRADIQFASKEVCRRMSRPRQCDWLRIKRLGRYLVGAPRVVHKFGWQDQPDTITAIVDTDFAGCLETRKSTSGGALMHGSHCLKTWSTTQSVIALSSGEAELYGIVRGASMSIGFASVARDLGVQLRVEIFSDSAAARGIVKRSGLGKVRHIDVQELWVQDAARRGQITVKAVEGINNQADILTKFVDKSGLDKHLPRLGAYHRTGRSTIAPQVERPHA